MGCTTGYKGFETVAHRPRNRRALASERADVKRAFGLRVRVLRESHGLSAEDLATRADVAPVVICNVERGSSEPGLSLIVTICRGLGVTPGALLGGIVHGPADALTPRQRQILSLLSDGQSYSEIAAALHVTVETVRSHARRIREQLGVRTSRELVGIYTNAHS
jgi:DNA-binding CsgD family transcriptional regulator